MLHPSLCRTAILPAVVLLAAPVVRAQPEFGDEPLETTEATPAEETPAEETPAEETSIEETPTGATPAEASTDEAATPTGATTSIVAPAPTPPYRPYSVPFLLRPLPAVHVARLDTVFAPHDAYGPAASGTDLDIVQLVTVGVRVQDWLMAVARMGWNFASSPGAPGLSNLVLGVNLTTPIEGIFRLSGFLAVGLPVGTDSGAAANHRNARLARMAMDNAMFLTDHASGIAGVGFGFVDAGLTVQAEATLLAFGRAQGMGDEAVVNSTFGLFVGYFIVPELSVGGELHHQHFLSDPAALTTDPYAGALRSQTSGSLGVRFHVPIDSVWMRPALAWSIGFDRPLSGDAWQSFQVDLPFFFQ